jgi:hypothetical protein
MSISCCSYIGVALLLHVMQIQADRAISTGKLKALLLLHIQPINVVVYDDSQGILVLRLVSRLDAFSVYLVRT